VLANLGDFLRALLPAGLAGAPVWDVPYLWIGFALALGGGAIVWRGRTEPIAPGDCRWAHPAWAPIAVLATLPFLAFEPQSPRLYLTFTFVGLSWIGWGWRRLGRGRVAPVVATIALVVYGLSFAVRFTQHVEAGSFWRFFARTLAAEVAPDPESPTWLVHYGRTHPVGLQVSWGLPLALGDPIVRRALVGLGGGDGAVRVVFPGVTRACERQEPPARSVALLAHDAPEPAPFAWCRADCERCTELPWQRAVRQPGSGTPRDAEQHR
jgi:hypothetical protein